MIDEIETRLRAAGWRIGTFGTARKWWNPSKDDGSRYDADNPRALRYICEDHPADGFKATP